ncbi:MAG: dTDP-glucose 4,6-dehydratase, partial [Caldisericia bacterium]|nr:dTDP-glucose 4,6-dehydratase [Caldisericia bacterium]
FINGDICNKQLVSYIFRSFNIQGVIHFAAESHVDNSISNPGIFIQTNVNGTFTLLDVARNYWMESPNKYKTKFMNCRFHNISTDEVYGSLSKTGFFSEETPYAPNSPYSASKASADMIVRSYSKTYGLNTVISNCSNNYGPKQHSEKFIPTIIHNCLSENTIPVYGDGKNIRDWLYVEDHCKGIDKVFHNGLNGEKYNIGGNAEKNNICIAETICKILDSIKPISQKYSSYTDLIKHVQDRPGHDKRYAIDASKIRNKLGWEPVESFESGILKTIQWHLSKFQMHPGD